MCAQERRKRGRMCVRLEGPAGGPKIFEPQEQRTENCGSEWVIGFFGAISEKKWTRKADVKRAVIGILKG